MVTKIPSTVADSLPDDLIEFYTLGGLLEVAESYSDSFLAIRPLAELKLEPIEIEPCVADFFLPHPDSVTLNAFPMAGVNLAVISAGEYDAHRLLVWLPEIERYAIWNSLDHSVRLFNKHVHWQTIVETPSRVLPDRAEGELHLVPDYATPIAVIQAAHRETTIASLLRLRRPRFVDFAYCCVVVVAMMGIGFIMRTSELPAISPETFDQIEIGMSEGEVLQIVRGSPGWYDDVYTNYGELQFGDVTRGPHELRRVFKGLGRGRTRYVWASQDGILTVEFDGNGAVSDVILTYPADRESSHPERWPWWKRLLNRETPGRERAIMFGPF